MSDLGKRPPDANATIQLDQLADVDQVALVEELGAPRSLPPPLPPISQQPSSGSQSASKHPGASAAEPTRSAARLVAYAVAFVVLLAGAIAAGLLFGRTLGGGATTVTQAAAPTGSLASEVPVPKPSAKPTAAASAPRDTLVLPTVELKSGE